jgi:hypothetical protein
MPVGQGNPNKLTTKDLFNLALQMQQMKMATEKFEQDKIRQEQAMALQKEQLNKITEELALKKQALDRQSEMAEGVLGEWSRETGMPLGSVAAENVQKITRGLESSQVPSFLGQYRPQAAGTFEGAEGTGGRYLDPVSKQWVTQDFGTGRPTPPPTAAQQNDLLLSTWLSNPTDPMFDNPVTANRARLLEQRELRAGTRIRSITESDAQGSRETLLQITPGLPRPGGATPGPTVTPLAQGEKSRILAPVVQADLQKKGIALQTQAMEVKNLLTKVMTAEKPLLSVPQNIANTVANLWTRIVDPKFNPATYEGKFQELINNAPLSAEVKSQIEQHFQIGYRVPVTGAQAGMQEIERLRADYLHGTLTEWEFLAKATGILQQISEKFDMVRNISMEGTLDALWNSPIMAEISSETWMEQFKTAPVTPSLRSQQEDDLGLQVEE